MPSSPRRRKAKLIGRRRLGAWDFPDGSDLAFRNPWARNAGSGSATGSRELRKNGRGWDGSSDRPARASRRGRRRRCPSHPTTASTRARSASSRARLRRRCTLIRRSFTTSQSSTSSKRRGSSRPTSKLRRRRASGSAAQRSLCSAVAKTPICAHWLQRKEASRLRRSVLASEIGIPDSHVGEHLAKDLRVDRIAEQEGRCHRAGWSLCWLRRLTSRNEMSLTLGSTLCRGSSKSMHPSLMMVMVADNNLR